MWMEDAEGVLSGVPIDPEGRRFVLLVLRGGRRGTPLEAADRGSSRPYRWRAEVPHRPLCRSAALYRFDLGTGSRGGNFSARAGLDCHADRRPPQPRDSQQRGGDGLIALFGAPHADDNHALMACYAAVELVNRIKLLDDPALQVRVGVHSGYVVAHVLEAGFSSLY